MNQPKNVHLINPCTGDLTQYQYVRTAKDIHGEMLMYRPILGGSEVPLDVLKQVTRNYVSRIAEQTTPRKRWE